jgi:hypothetical protein
MRELELDAPDLEGMRGVVHDSGVLVLGGPGGSHGELARVDEPVPGRRHPVPVEAGGDVPVGHDVGFRALLLPGLGQKGRQAAGVVDMAMCVDGGGEGRGVDGAHRGEGPVARGEIAGVHEDEAGLGAQGGDIGPGVEEDQPGGQFLVLAAGAPEIAPRDLPAPEALSQIEHRAHVGEDASTGKEQAAMARD